jgi:myo-inositol-1(or 4)-monophosphatase
MAHDPLLLSTAVEAVLHAGAMQVAALGQRIRIDKKGVIDLVTEVDLAVETWFRAFIHDRFPDHRILAEELQDTARRGEDSSPYCWIFDPIDGTTNYAHGLPIWSVGIGLEQARRVVLGVVYDAMRDELFLAERGAGAWLNDARLAVSTTDRLETSLLVTGFPYDIGTNPDNNLREYATLSVRARAVRRLGSALLDFAYVAAGRFEGFWELTLSPWDVAAGAILVEEAGGQVTDLSGAPVDLDHPRIVASNGRIHAQLLSVLKEARAA